jgi:hypothetical protein|tara:strand:+ start:2026 stop:2760 length:735 start_codon:yes stop_codon:yes gene_type:complete
MLEIFERHVQGIKRGSNGEYKGICPFHDDTKPSFSFRDDGVFYCHACNVKGNIRKFAEMVGEKAPNLANKVVIKKKTWQAPTSLPIKYFDVINAAMDELLLNYDKYCKDLPWNKDIVKKLFIGWDNGFVFPYFDAVGDLVNIKWHKRMQVKGHAQTFVYPYWHMLHKYKGNRTLYVVEGEKDCISMISSGRQAISFNNGANCTPSSDLIGVITSKFSDISVIFDDDEAGKRAEVKMIGLLNGQS